MRVGGLFIVHLILATAAKGYTEVYAENSDSSEYDAEELVLLMDPGSGEWDAVVEKINSVVGLPTNRVSREEAVKARKAVRREYQENHGTALGTNTVLSVLFATLGNTFALPVRLLAAHLAPKLVFDYLLVDLVVFALPQVLLIFLASYVHWIVFFYSLVALTITIYFHFAVRNAALTGFNFELQPTTVPVVQYPQVSDTSFRGDLSLPQKLAAIWKDSLLKKTVMKVPEMSLRRTVDFDFPLLDSNGVFVQFDNVRGAVMLMIIIAIFGADINFFPTEHLKRANWGLSLMDIGVGSMVFTSSVVSCRQSRSGRRPFPLKQFGLCLAAGVLRFGFVELLDYGHSTIEYGVHWNFFFTLSCIMLANHVFYVLRADKCIVGVLILVVYQIILNCGWQAIILRPRRDVWWEADKEGYSSTLGYIGSFFLSKCIGNICFHSYSEPLSPFLPSHLTTVEKMKLALPFIKPPPPKPTEAPFSQDLWEEQSSHTTEFQQMITNPRISESSFLLEVPSGSVVQSSSFESVKVSHIEVEPPPPPPLAAGRGVSRETGNQEKETQAKIIALFTVDVVLWITFAFLNHFVARPSRRSGNATFMVWAVAFHTFHVAATLVFRAALPLPVIPAAKLLSRHQLPIFVFANLILGFFNIVTDVKLLPLSSGVVLYTFYLIAVFLSYPIWSAIYQSIAALIKQARLAKP